jgi:hypothetical protein
MKKILLLFTLTLLNLTYVNSQTNQIEPNSTYKEIDSQNNIVELLNNEKENVRIETVNNILSNPNNYNPPVLYALSKELFEENKKDEAMYWFYIAQLRARYDSNLCLDASAKQGVGILNGTYGPNINEYAFNDVDKLELTVNKVVDFVKKNEENYDHRWLNLHGMGAIINSMDKTAETPEMIEPKDKWTAIKKKTIDDYYNGFIEFVKSKKK